MENIISKEDEVSQTGVYDVLDDIHSHAKELSDRLTKILIPDPDINADTQVDPADDGACSCSPMMQKAQYIHDILVFLLRRIQL